MKKNENQTLIDQNLTQSSVGVSDKFKRIRATQERFIKTHESYVSELEDIDDAFKAYIEVDEWPKKEKEEREQAGKPVGDHARFTNVVDVISGNQIVGRTQGQAHAFENDDLMTADFINLYLQYRRQRQEIDHQDSDIFRNGALAMRSHREYFLKPNPKDGSMEVLSEERPPDEVFIEKPFRRFDGKDAPGIFHAQWVSVGKVKALFDLSDADLSGLETRKQASPVTTESTHILDEYSFPSDGQSDKFFDQTTNQVRLIRYWKKWDKKIYRVVNLINPKSLDDANVGEFNTRAEATQAAIEFASQQGEELTEELIENMIDIDQIEIYSLHIISGRVELFWSKEWGDFTPFTHFFGYWVNGRASGLWKRTKDEIITLNFLWNKLIERLGKIGWMPLLLEEGALSEGQSQETALDNWRDGGVVMLANGAISKNKVKVETDHSLQSIGPYIGIIEHLGSNIDQKSGANDAFQGISPGANTAGIAIERLQQKGAAVVEPLMDNFKRFQRHSDLMEITMLNRAFRLRPMHTQLKMERIIGGMVNEESDETVQNFAQAINSGTTGSVDISIGRILEKLDVIEYDIRIDSKAVTPSLKIASLQAMAQLAGAVQIPIPPEVAIELFDFLPSKVKTKWLKALALRGIAPGDLPQQENGKQQTENISNPNGQTI